MKQVEITNVETENVSVIKKMDFTYDNEKYYLECLFDESCFTVILFKKEIKPDVWEEITTDTFEETTGEQLFDIALEAE